MTGDTNDVITPPIPPTFKPRHEKTLGTKEEIPHSLLAHQCLSSMGKKCMIRRDTVNHFSLKISPF